MCAYMDVYLVCSATGCQRRELGSLELESQIVVSCWSSIGAANGFHL